MRPEYDGSQDYDLILRLSENAARIVHIPEILYFWRVHPGSVSSNLDVKPYCLNSARAALSAHLVRNELQGKVYNSSELSTYRIEYELIAKPLISIIFTQPYDSSVESAAQYIKQQSSYPKLEFLARQSNPKKSNEQHNPINNTLINIIGPDPKDARAVETPFGHQLAEKAKGDYLIFYNPALRPLSSDWIEELLRYGQRSDIGAVGPIILFKGRRIFGAGLVLGLDALVSYAYQGAPDLYSGYMSRLSYVNNVSALPLDCLLIPRKRYQEVTGIRAFQTNTAAAVDLCLQLRAQGKWLVIVPNAKQRFTRVMKHKKGILSNDDYQRLIKYWPCLSQYHDPFYHHSFNAKKADYFCKITKPNHKMR